MSGADGRHRLPLSSQRGVDTGKVLAKGVDDEDVMFARPGPAVEYWEDED